MGTLKSKTVLIIEDEQQMRHLVRRVLEQAGAAVIEAPDGEMGLRLLFKERPDLVILDILMPQMDGWEVLRRIRQMTDTPVIMLTVLNGGPNEARALRGGANDYITKPFDVESLLARAEAAIKKSEAVTNRTLYDDGYLLFDPQERRVAVDGDRVRLTRKEYDLLDCLIGNAGRVCTYEYILEKVWGGKSQGSIENVQVFIWQLRQKIEPDSQEPVYILNEQGVGYYFSRRNQV